MNASDYLEDYKFIFSICCLKTVIGLILFLIWTQWIDFFVEIKLMRVFLIIIPPNSNKSKNTKYNY